MAKQDKRDKPSGVERKPEYVTVNATILRDLVTAKSKLTDIIAWMHDYDQQLAMVHALRPLMEIIYSKRYVDSGEDE